MEAQLNSTASLLVLIVIVVAIVITVRNKLRKNKQPYQVSNEDAAQLVPVQAVSQEYHYERRDLIMTPTETEFFKLLNGAVGQSYFVFPQVHLSSIFEHKVTGQDWWKAFHHINRKSVDFVICDRESVRPLFAIELDDWSHKLDKRMKRDQEVERIFEGANFPLLRFGHNGPYTSASIAQSIKASGVLTLTPALNS